MLKTYICVHVHEDGDNELTKRELTKEQGISLIYEGDLCFNVSVANRKLTKELLDYGNEPEDIKKAIEYIMKAPVNESCIVGKV
jgi:hypothetical protein